MLAAKPVAVRTKRSTRLKEKKNKGVSSHALRGQGQRFTGWQKVDEAGRVHQGKEKRATEAGSVPLQGPQEQRRLTRGTQGSWEHGEPTMQSGAGLQNPVLSLKKGDKARSPSGEDSPAEEAETESPAQGLLTHLCREDRTLSLLSEVRVTRTPSTFFMSFSTMKSLAREAIARMYQGPRN